MQKIENGMLHYESCGLPNVWLKGGFDVYETAYGEGISIHDISGLHKALGLSIAKDKPFLTGKEVRFLRTELDMSQTSLANILGVSESTVRNWEKDRGAITAASERLLRTIYISTFSEGKDGNCHIKELVEHISQLNRDVHWVRLELEEDENGWSAQVA